MCQALVGAVLIAASAGMAQATRHTGLCGADLPAQGRQTVQSGHTTVVWAPSRWPIPVGQHFSLTVQVCAPEGQTAPAVLRVDADMPLHKHGMNYRTTLKELGPGRARAEGLMFHMPGRWRVRIIAQAVNVGPQGFASVVTGDVTDVPCPADLDGGAGDGQPDGAVDINDLLYFLAQYEQGALGADLDDGTGLGRPDAAVDINDLLYFLQRYENGC